ncbi:GNAT family N-acetyltransferase, partial [Enterobacter hormaechei]
RPADGVGSLSQRERALTPPLQGEGFRLRPWRPEDLESLLRHANDAEVSRGLRDRFPYPYTREDGEAFLAGRVLAPGTLNL